MHQNPQHCFRNTSAKATKFKQQLQSKSRIKTLTNSTKTTRSYQLVSIVVELERLVVAPPASSFPGEPHRLTDWLGVLLLRLLLLSFLFVLRRFPPLLPLLLLALLLLRFLFLLRDLHALQALPPRLALVSGIRGLWQLLLRRRLLVVVARRNLREPPVPHFNASCQSPRPSLSLRDSRTLTRTTRYLKLCTKNG